MGAFIDITRQKFNRLTAIKPIKKDKWGEFIWECLCDCGQATRARLTNLKTGHVKSCGCLHEETARKLNLIHGEAGTRLYQIWRDIKRRCLNPEDKNYKYYGKKGISICGEWQNDYLIFKKWALSSGYTSNLTIDRINHKGNYEPSNCQWITLSENARKAHRDRREWRSKGNEQ